MRAAACILLILTANCSPKPGDAAYTVQLSADRVENIHLRRILLSRNRDSIRKCAEADYAGQKYYIFWMSVPAEARFNNYLAAYARQKYNIILVNCGCKNHVGGYYYNNTMAEFFLEAKQKPFDAIYVEARNLYNKALTSYVSKPFMVKI